MIRHRFAIIVAVVGLILASGVFSLVESAPSEQPLQSRATQTPAGVPTITPTAVPTRLPRVTPTPEPTRPPRVTPTPEPTQSTLPTVNPPQPMPDPPGQGDSPPVEQQPAGRQPLIPGKHNRFEITLYTCPAGIDPASDEAAFLASCTLHVDAPPENVHFQMRDGDATHSTSDYDDDSMYVFDDITVTPGRKFFILEEYLPGFADPAVFCSENGGASARVPAPLRVIRPQLSSYSNVDYTCTWFKIPLTADSIHLTSHTCLTAPNASATFDWFWINCPAPHDKFFTLTDANGAHTEGIVTSIIWTDVDFDPTNSVEISVPALDTGYENRVFCGTFNSGDELAVIDLAFTVPKMGGDAPAEHVCRWYRFPGQASYDQSIQIPNTLDVWARLCPPDLDPTGDPHDYIVACQQTGTPAQGVKFWVVYPSGQIGMLPANQVIGNKAVAQFGLIGAGTVTVVPAMPSGYSSYRYICTSPGVSYPDTGGKPTLPTTYYGWGKKALCRIFYVPDSAAGIQPAIASIPMAGVASGQFGLAESAPSDQPPAIATNSPGLQLPIATRPPLVTQVPTFLPRWTPTPVPTQTPHPDRHTPVPTRVPRVTPTPVATNVPTVIAPNPQPNQPTVLPDTEPTQLSFLPGMHNRVEISLHQCPAGVDTAGEEAALIAACPQVSQTEEMFSAFGVLVDDVSGVFTWDDLDYTPGQVINEEVEYPSRGLDIPYPATPVVYCSEADAPHARIERLQGATITPNFSELSNIEYTCDWFKIPLETTSLFVYTWTCYTPPPGGANLDWHKDVCAPTKTLDPLSLGDANGWRPGTQHGLNEWVWNDLAFGPTNDAVVVLNFEGDFAVGANVFCDGSMQVVTEQESWFRVEESGSGVRAYRCDVFGTRENFNLDQSLQSPNQFRAETWTCPAGFDPASTFQQFRSTCIEPRPGIGISLTYPGGFSGTLMTTNANPARAEFGLIGVGHYVVTPQPVPGFQRVAFCWSQGAPGEWRVDSAAYFGQFAQWG